VPSELAACGSAAQHRRQCAGASIGERRRCGGTRQTQEQEWSPGLGSAGMGGAGARAGVAGVELRHGKGEASTGPAAEEEE
jgi:hypothetical protein